MSDDDKVQTVISTSGELSFKEMERAHRFYTMILDEARSAPNFDGKKTIGELVSPKKMEELWEKSVADFIVGPDGVSKTD